MVCVLFLSRSRRLVSFLRSVWSLLHSRSKFLAKRRAAIFPKSKKNLGKERAEKVLVDAITIDGRKEWICKFGSESNGPQDRRHQVVEKKSRQSRDQEAEIR